MRTIIKISSIIIIACSVVGYFFVYEKPIIKNIPLKNNKIVVFGDSLVEGVGATKGNDLVSLLSRDLGKEVLNYGKSGDTTRDALGRIQEASDEGAGLAVIILGGNDVLRKIPQDETIQNLEKIITLFQEKGAAVILVGVRSGLVGDGRGSDYEKLAEKNQSIYISDILQDVFGKREYMSDAVHPNDAGYAVIEKRLASIIRKSIDNR